MADRGRQLSEALCHAGVPDDAPIGLIPRNRPLSVAALLELLIAGRSIVMIYAFQSGAAIARDIESLRLAAVVGDCQDWRSEEHTSELQSLMRISYAVFCLNKTKTNIEKNNLGA